MKPPPAPEETSPAWECPVPLSGEDRIQMAHGGGGRAMHRLLEHWILPAFANPYLALQHDGAVLPASPGNLVMTTDSFVVQPLFFPGGDIGSLAVNGTVNDLAMCGAVPRYLTLGLILEEGLPLTTLGKILASLRRAADAAGVILVAGDTKVVDHGKADQIYINTAGVGFVAENITIHSGQVRSDDAILLSGDLGRHGMAVMASREGFAFESPIVSDCAPLNHAVQALLQGGFPVHCLRDLTRGGLASALNEIARASGKTMRIAEEKIPVTEPVRGACEILGLDPLTVANEGRFIAILPEEFAEKAVSLLRQQRFCEETMIIGEVLETAPSPRVLLQTRLGPERILDMIHGEPLPRIC